MPPSQLTALQRGEELLHLCDRPRRRVQAAVQEVWFGVLAAAGARGMTTEQVETAFAGRHGGLHPSSGTVAQMEQFLAALKGGEL